MLLDHLIRLQREKTRIKENIKKRHSEQYSLSIRHMLYDEEDTLTGVHPSYTDGVIKIFRYYDIPREEIEDIHKKVNVIKV